MFLCRRLIKVLIIVLIPNSLFSLRAVLFLIIQAAHMMYLIKTRSFSQYINQIIEVLNEFVLFILAIFIIDYRSESEWTDTAVDAFIGIIVSHLCILLIVTIIIGIAKFVRFIKSRQRLRSEKTQSQSKSDENCRYADDLSVSINDKFPKSNFTIPNNTNMFIVRSMAYMDQSEEEKKIEDSQSDML